MINIILSIYLRLVLRVLVIFRVVELRGIELFFIKLKKWIVVIGLVLRILVRLNYII